MEETNQSFSAEEMERRAKRLKAEGKMPPLADVLRIVQSVCSNGATMMPAAPAPRRKRAVKMSLEQLGQNLVEESQKLDPQEQARIRRENYEKITGKPFRPESKPEEAPNTSPKK
jgi:tRNA A37 N6-isopentenylltransferase MiaA